MSHHESTPLHHETTSQQVAVRTLPDSELIDGARSRRNAHLGELMRRYSKSLHAKLAGFAGEQTDEIITDTFIALPARLASYVDDGKFPQWLFRIAFNIARTRRRSAHRREQFLVDTAADGVRMPSIEFRIEEARLLDRARDILSPSEREVWFLSFVGHPPAEIGAILGIKEAAVNVRLHRARARLMRSSDELGM